MILSLYSSGRVACHPRWPMWCYFKNLVSIYQNDVSLFVMPDAIYTKNRDLCDFFE